MTEKGANYGAADQPPYPQPGAPPAAPINEPPPQYEPPKQGEPYGQAPPPPQGGYPPQGAYPPQGGAYPPQGGAYPPQGYQATTTVVTQPIPATTTVVKLRLGANPQALQCQFCQAQVVTSLQYENGLLTWLAVGGLCIIGCWLGCQFIPLCIDDLKDVDHVCPNCRRVVGRYERLN